MDEREASRGSFKSSQQKEVDLSNLDAKRGLCLLVVCQ